MDAQTFCVASQEFCMASQVFCKASQEFCKASQAFCMASQAFCKASHVFCVVSRAFCIDDHGVCSINCVKIHDVYCKLVREAIELLDELKGRFKECGLEVHPIMIKIVYCKKSGGDLKRKSLQFDFFGFSFQPRLTRLKKGGVFLQYDCKVSRKSKKRILQELRDLRLHKKSQSTIEDLAILLNPKIRGWINYYGKVKRTSMKPVFYYLHHRLIKWILNKYKRFKNSRVLAVKWLRRVTVHYPNLFYHWSLGYQLT